MSAFPSHYTEVSRDSIIQALNLLLPSSPPILTGTTSFGGTLCSSPTSEGFLVDEPSEDNAVHLTAEQTNHPVNDAGALNREQSFQEGYLAPAVLCPSEGSSGRSSPLVVGFVTPLCLPITDMRLGRSQ